MKKKVFFEEFDSLYYFHGSSQRWEMQGQHFHKQYEIILFLSDGARLEIGERLYDLKKGDIFFINNKEYHRTIGKEGAEYQRYVLMFEPEVIAPLSKAFDYNFMALFEGYQGDIVKRMNLSEQNLRQVEERMRGVEQCISMDIKDENNKVRLKLSLLELLTLLNVLFESFADISAEEAAAAETAFWTGETVGEPVPYRDRIEQIKKYIAAHVEEKLELDDIADHFYMSRYYLSHYFRKETGFTLIQYITNQKITAAKKMLKSGMSVTDVAMRLSYNSDSHFISIFKKMTGTTPKRYAKEGNH